MTQDGADLSQTLRKDAVIGHIASFASSQNAPLPLLRIQSSTDGVAGVVAVRSDEDYLYGSKPKTDVNI
jgi:hypothetical protein